MSPTIPRKEYPCPRCGDVADVPFEEPCPSCGDEVERAIEDTLTEFDMPPFNVECATEAILEIVSTATGTPGAERAPNKEDRS